MPNHLHFASSYGEARSKFIAACNTAELPYTTHVNPNSGPQGEALCTDLVSAGPDGADRVLIVNSGIHGVEGFCGSAAMTAWLASGGFGEAAQAVRIILIHALNPYGFAWLRRVNEDNVDLNRNFINGTDLAPHNPDYEALHEVFIPQDWDDEIAANIKQTLSQHAAAHGLLSMQARVCRGQYQYSDGLFYGGSRATWSHLMFKRILRGNINGARHIMLLDFHTGLGQYGVPELICATPPDEGVKSWFTTKLTCAQLGDAVGPKLTGTIGQGLSQVAHGSNLYSITAEFGTYDVYRVLMAIIADNWLHVRGHPQSGLGGPIKQEIRDCFYPDQDDWRELVLSGSQRILDEAAAGLADI